MNCELYYLPSLDRHGTGYTRMPMFAAANARKPEERIHDDKVLLPPDREERENRDAVARSLIDQAHAKSTGDQTA